jgi:hypothetical protein
MTDQIIAHLSYLSLIFSSSSMLEIDAISRHHGLEKGQIVKLIHTGGIVHSYETYRCVM